MMNNGITGSLVSVMLHGGIIVLFTWFSLHPVQKRPTVIDLSLLDEQPQRSVAQPPQPRTEPRTVEPRPVAKAPLPEQAPPRPAEPQTQKVAVSENLVPVAAPRVESPPSLPPPAPAAPARPAPSVTAAAPRPDEPGTPAEKARKKYLREQFTYIRDAILAKLSYPHMARKMGWGGTVKVSFCVCEDGSVTDVKVVKSSGYNVLDSNALGTIRMTAPFPKPPVMAEVVMPITYKLD